MEGLTLQDDLPNLPEEFQCNQYLKQQILNDNSQGEQDEERPQSADMDPIAKFYFKLIGKHKLMNNLESKLETRRKRHCKLKQVDTKSTYLRVNEAKRQYLISTLRQNPQITTVSLSKATNLSRTKVSQIRKEYELTGNIRITDSGNSKSLPRVQLEETQNKAILEVVNNNPKIGLQELVQVLQRQYGVRLRRSCLHKRLTQDLRYSYSPIATFATSTPTLNDEETILQRGRFCKAIQSYKLQFIFACGVDKVTVCPKNNFAWLPKRQGTQKISSAASINRSEVQTVNVISTINAVKLIKSDLFVGELTEQILLEHLREGFINNSKQSLSKHIILISHEICQQIFKVDKSIKNEFAKIKLEQNQNKAHNQYDEQFLNIFFKKLDIEYAISPRFSPMLHPCYHFFQILQKKFKAYKFLKRKIKSQQQIKTGLAEVIRFMPQSSYHHYFCKISKYLKISDIKVSHFIEHPQG